MGRLYIYPRTEVPGKRLVDKILEGWEAIDIDYIIIIIMTNNM